MIRANNNAVSFRKYVESLFRNRCQLIAFLAGQRYAATILDLPMFEDSTAAGEWCSDIDGVLLAVKSEIRTCRLTQSNSEIENTGVRVRGSVMMGREKELPASLESFF